MRERSQKAKACHGVRRHFADSSRLYDGCMEDVARVTRKGGVKEGCAKKNCKGKGSRGRVGIYTACAGLGEVHSHREYCVGKYKKCK